MHGCLASTHGPRWRLASPLSGMGYLTDPGISLGLLLADSKVSSSAIKSSEKCSWTSNCSESHLPVPYWGSTMPCRLGLPIGFQEKGTTISHSIEQHSWSWRTFLQRNAGEGRFLVLYTHRETSRKFVGAKGQDPALSRLHYCLF